MDEPLFIGSSVESRRVIYTPSSFAKQSLFYLQEAGSLHALQAHTSSREGLASTLFFVVLSGSGSLEYEGQQYPLHTGSMVFIDCRRPYRHTPNPCDLWALQWAHFDGIGMSGVYEKYKERGGQPVFESENLQKITILLSELFSLASAEDHMRDMRINERLTALLTYIMCETDYPEPVAHSGLKKQVIRDIRLYLEEHYSERIRLEDLADRFFINKFYLARAFKTQMGTTIFSYIDHLRVTRAKQLLRFSSLTVEEIGQVVGLEDPAYFSRVFKKIEGIAPGEYRKTW